MAVCSWIGIECARTCDVGLNGIMAGGAVFLN